MLFFNEVGKNKSKNIQLNILGMTALDRILRSFTIPVHFTDSSLHPFSLAVILNDIGINQRRTILELGSGISTLVIAKYFDMYAPEGKIYSVEEDKGWLDVLHTLLEKENLTSRVELIHAPVKTENNKRWYDKDFISRFAANGVNLDTLLVDGPQAWRRGSRTVRKNVPKEIFKLLNENSSVFLDDIDRYGEKLAMIEWSRLHGLRFSVLPSNTAFATKGKKYNFSIL